MCSPGCQQLECAIAAESRALAEERAHVDELEKVLRQLQKEAECAILEESHKWEAREARLVRSLEDLEWYASMQCTQNPRMLQSKPTKIKSETRSRGEPC